MLRTALNRCLDVVTAHNRLTLLGMLLLTGVVLAGIPQLDTASQTSASVEDFPDVERVQKAEYVADAYGDAGTEDNRTIVAVYVRDDDGNVLSKSALLTQLRYQQAIAKNDTLDAVLLEDGIQGIATIVGTRAVDADEPTRSAQRRALEDASPSEVQRLVEQTLTENPRARRFLPADHGTAPVASDTRLLVALDGSRATSTLVDAIAPLAEEARERRDAGFFTLGPHALDDYRSHFFGEMVELVLPVALILILGVLAFTYRDLVDVVVGMTGVLLSVLWTFGLLGWLGVAAGLVSIVPVVLVSGLSIDFGFHVFNRYREERGPDEGIRRPMSRGTQLVATALVLVTATAAIGFLANLVNPLPVVRNLGISITLGVVSAFVLFLTVVPALKISIDGVLERIGLDRRKLPLGHGRVLQPLLARSVWVARRAAPAVLALAVILGAAGALAWTELDEESFQQADGDVAQWKQDLPGPLGWETHWWPRQSQHVDDVYQPASAADAIQSRVLVEGAITRDDTLVAIETGVERVAETELLVDQPGTPAVRSPLTAMRRLSARDPAFGTAFEEADADGDGVPDRNLEALYDAMYAADADLARQVIDREDGEYRSLLVTFALDADYADAEQVVTTLTADAEAMEHTDGSRSATLVGTLAVDEAVLDSLVGGILLTMVIALLAIVASLAVVFRVMHGSASLGAVVSVPIALVIGLVVGGMYLLAIPLTLLTALLMSLVVGLGVDYSIHVGDRYADELAAGASSGAALEAAVTGTGGALFGSTLTSAAAFGTLVLIPHPQLQSFGAIVVVALVTAFVASVVVLPSLLLLWGRRFSLPTADADTVSAPSPED